VASRRRRLEPADAEGSLFTYFATRDELLNQLYLELKTDLREAMLSAVPQAATARDKLRHAWQQYVHWGVTFPQKRRALAQAGPIPAFPA